MLESVDGDLPLRIDFWCSMMSHWHHRHHHHAHGATAAVST